MIQSHQTTTGKADTHGSLPEQSQSWHGQAQHGGNLPSTISLQQEGAQDLLLHTQTTGSHTEPTAVSPGSCMGGDSHSLCPQRDPRELPVQSCEQVWGQEHRHLQTLPWRAQPARPRLQELGANPQKVSSAKLCCRDPAFSTSNLEPRASLTDLSRAFVSVYSAQS